MPLPVPAPVEPGDTLADRVILITGASGGLGAPLARACAAQGATVVLHGRIERKLDALYDEVVAPARIAGCFMCVVGGGKRDRTADLLHAMQALSQLSYTPTDSLKL